MFFSKTGVVNFDHVSQITGTFFAQIYILIILINEVLLKTEK